MPTLVVKYKDGTRTYPLVEGMPAFIGRAKECDVHLPSPAVSRRHAVVIFKSGICGIKDLGSFNGTLINGKTLASAQHMTPADVVQISSFVIRLAASDAGAQAADGARQRSATVVLPADAAAASGDSGEGMGTAFEAASGGQEEPPPGARRMREAATRYMNNSARALPNSHILLPRATEPANDVEEMLENLPAPAPAAAGAGRPGRDTLVYAPGVSPEGTVEMNFPAEYARELRKETQERVEAIMPGGLPAGVVDTASEFDFPDAPADAAPVAGAAPAREAGSHDTSGRFREGGGRFDTDYFRGEPGTAPSFDPEDAFSFDDADGASAAEKIIPMHSAERAPRLKLEWDDDETNRALEELVADVSPAVSAFRNSRLAELGLLGEDEAMLAFSQAVGADESGGGRKPEGLAALDEIDPLSALGAAMSADAAGEPGGEDAGGASPDETGAADMFAPLETPMDPEEKRRGSAFDTGSLPVPAPPAPAGVSVFAAGKTAIPGVDAVVVTPALMDAVEKRLALYPALLALADERRALRASDPELSPAAAAELDRQDAEAASLPSADEADKLLAAHATRSGEADADAGDAALARAGELATAQWILVRDSGREALPLVYKEAYKLAADEELAREFVAARINHGRLLGGAIYLLALEGIAESADAERRAIAEEMRRLAGRGLEKDAGGILGKLGVIGDTVNKVKNRTEIREISQSLEERDREFAAAAERTRRESAFVEKSMNREFRMVFMQTAKHFGRRDEMPVSVRAFLRYGVVGFKPWWMRADIRDFIIRDCTGNVLPAVEPGPGKTVVLHADEYLAAVADMECPPLPDDSPSGREQNSDEWLTDRAFRRIVNASSYNILMDDMLSKLDSKLQEYEDKSSELELRVAELRDWSSSDNQDEMFSLQTEQQVIAIRYENMQRHIKRIEKEVVASILEAVEDSEGRFRHGELRMPDPEELVARESAALAVMAKRIGGSRQRFMPMVVREQTTMAGLNDRRAVAGRLGAVEKFDPGVFVSAIIPAKKKENRVELRLSPVVVIFPCSGARGLFSTPRDGMEGGHLVIPVCFTKREMAETAFANLLADFRWETSRLQAGQDVEHSDTLAGAFLRFRREFAEEPKPRRERGYIFTELTDKRNWRRVYAAFLADAQNSTRRLPARNPALYENVIAPYFG